MPDANTDKRVSVSKCDTCRICRHSYIGKPHTIKPHAIRLCATDQKKQANISHVRGRHRASFRSNFHPRRNPGNNHEPFPYFVTLARSKIF